MRSFRTSRLVAAIAAAAVLGGCTSASTESADPLVAQRTVTVTSADSGQTVHVAIGDKLIVKLGTTFWTFTAPEPGGVVQPGPVVVKSAKYVNHGGTCMPGEGCGTVSESFVAKAAGRVVLAASRVSCGEALRCTGAQSRFRLTIVVS